MASLSLGSSHCVYGYLLLFCPLLLLSGDRPSISLAFFPPFTISSISPSPPTATCRPSSVTKRRVFCHSCITVGIHGHPSVKSPRSIDLILGALGHENTPTGQPQCIHDHRRARSRMTMDPRYVSPFLHFSLILFCTPRAPTLHLSSSATSRQPHFHLNSSLVAAQDSWRQGPRQRLRAVN
jgi:hypothetical protein